MTEETQKQAEHHAASSFLDGTPLGTAQEEREMAKRWIETAAQHARNETYLRNYRNRLFREGVKLSPEFRAKWAETAFRLDALGDTGANNGALTFGDAMAQLMASSLDASLDVDPR